MDTLVLAARVAVSLAVVLGVLWFLQRRVSRSTRVKRAASAVTVVTRQGIAPKASVVLVDVEGSRYLLGVTEQSVTLLSAGEAPVAPATLTAVPVLPAPALSAPSVSGSAGAFAQVLRAEAEEGPAAPAASVATTPATAAASSDSAASTDAQDVVLRRPRDRASRTGRPSAAPSPLAGSILSAETWRQAGNALRQRRAG